MSQPVSYMEDQIFYAQRNFVTGVADDTRQPGASPVFQIYIPRTRRAEQGTAAPLPAAVPKRHAVERNERDFWRLAHLQSGDCN
jgi:hypothetical protein